MIQATNLFSFAIKIHMEQSQYLPNSKAYQGGSNINIENSSMTSFTDQKKRLNEHAYENRSKQ